MGQEDSKPTTPPKQAARWPEIILASRSPRRRALLRDAGIPFVTAVASVDERPEDSEPPALYAERLASAKANAVARTVGSGLVLGADTIVVLDGEILGKPSDAVQARNMLVRLRDRQHLVATALALVDAGSGWTARAVEYTGVYMRAYSDDEIEAYLATGDGLDKAGGYAIQHAGFQPVAGIRGSACNVIGLPISTLRHMLAGYCAGWTASPVTREPGA